MAEIKDLFKPKPKRMSPRNPNAVPVQPGQSMQLKVDVQSLPDVACLECGEFEFTNITRIKKMSRTVSPNGQEGNINVNMLKCSKCGWLFNPKQIADKEKAVSLNEQLPLNETIESAKEDTTDKILCRRCGTFHKPDEIHVCKEPA